MRAITVILYLALFLAWPAAAQKKCDPNPQCEEELSEPVVCKVFDGLLSIEKNGTIVQERVVVQYLQIENDVVVEIPYQGTLVVELRAGSLTANITEKPQEGDLVSWMDRNAEESQKYYLGSFLSVPENRYLFVQTTRDSVVLQTVDLIPNKPR